MLFIVFKFLLLWNYYYD